ncbi:Protein of unknown function [Thermobacillus xylanilyticus]|uniref:Uncharacterized protein n=1 Tax=Thermobacillus xylanilyticus TaxID=76633 RepID=A0ABN7S617_THEXY|nr:Protein of unknown function [Thermobacillus xylanilyticus]
MRFAPEEESRRLVQAGPVGARTRLGAAFVNRRNPAPTAMPYGPR